MLIKYLLLLIYLIFTFYIFYYCISLKYKFDQPILNIKIKKIRNLQIQARFANETSNKINIELKQFSGEYEELSSIETINNTNHQYTIENIYFLLTTNRQRLRSTIHFLKFWAKLININCLIVFEQHDYLYRRSIEYQLRINEIPCQIQRSNITRYEERYFQLIDFSWNFILNKNKRIEWLAIGDDDTIWFINNLLKTLQQYNSSKLIYLGNVSDRNSTIQRHGSYYAYGGAGILLTKSLVSLVSNFSQLCQKKFIHMYGGDEMIGKCLTEILKVNLTRNQHFHQLDHEGDIEGFFQSGIDGLVTLHHMFTWWELFPLEHLENEIDILNLIKISYEILNQDFLKRYFKINKQTNETFLLTNGYSFTSFNRILTKYELNQLELTWTGSQFYQRITRRKEKNKINYFFKEFNNQTNYSAIYQYKKEQIEIIFKD